MPIGPYRPISPELVPKAQQEPSFLDRLGGVRGLAGTGVRAVSGALAAEGGPTGAAIGAGGEGLAELVEGSLGRKTIPRVVAEAGISSIPFGSVFKPGRVLASAGLGALHAGGGAALREAAAGQTPDLKSVGLAAASGGMLNAALAKLLGGVHPPVAQPAKFEVETTAVPGGRVLSTKPGTTEFNNPPPPIFETTPHPSGGPAPVPSGAAGKVPYGAAEPAPYRSAAKQAIKTDIQAEKEAAAQQRIDDAIAEGKLAPGPTSVSESGSVQTPTGRQSYNQRWTPPDEEGGDLSELGEGGTPGTNAPRRSGKPGRAMQRDVKVYQDTLYKGWLERGRNPVEAAKLARKGVVWTTEGNEPGSIRIDEPAVAQPTESPVAIPAPEPTPAEPAASPLAKALGVRPKRTPKLKPEQIAAMTEVAARMRAEGVPEEAVQEALGRAGVKAGRVPASTPPSPPTETPSTPSEPPQTATAPQATSSWNKHPATIAAETPPLEPESAFSRSLRKGNVEPVGKVPDIAEPLVEEAAAPKAVNPLAKIFGVYDDPLEAASDRYGLIKQAKQAGEAVPEDIRRIAGKEAGRLAHEDPAGAKAYRELAGLVNPAEKVSAGKVPNYTPKASTGAATQAATVARQAKAATPTAEYLGWQEDSSNPNGGFPLFNVKGGAYDGSTVTAETLQKEGIAIPEPPAIDATTGEQLGQAEVLKAGGSPVQSIIDKLKGESGAADPSFLAALGRTGAGALAGGLVGGQLGHPFLGMAGGAALANAPQILSQMGAHPDTFNNLQEKIDTEGVKKTASKIWQTLPQIQRFNYLTSGIGLPANMLAGPYGSAVMAALEHGLSGDARGWAALQKLTPQRFLREWYASADEAKMLIMRGEMGHSADRAETQLGGMISGKWVGRPDLEALNPLQIPGIMMTAGDVAARKILEEAGITAEEARRITLTSEPETHMMKAIADFGRGKHRDITTPMLELSFPFRRTPANIWEQGMQRFPGLGFFMQGSRAVPDPIKQQIVQQLMSGGVGAASAWAGANLDPETAKYVQRYITNFAGQYSLPATMGFAAGQATQRKKPAIPAAISAGVSGLPLPTTDTLKDLANLLTGQGGVPRGAIPAAIRELFPAAQSTALKSNALPRRLTYRPVKP